MCPAGLGDCDLDAANGCEESLASSQHHCGACGHDCLGGACLEGVCQPFALHHESGQPWSMALSPTHVVWMNSDGRVEKIPKKGGPVTLLTELTFNPGYMQVLGEQVYLASYGGVAVKRVPLAGGALVDLTPGTAGGTGLAVDSDFIYWGSYQVGQWPSQGKVVRSPRGGGGPVQVLAEGQRYAASMAVDGSHLYWTDNTGEEEAGPVGGLRRVPLGGGAVETLFASHALGAVALDGTHAYVIYGGTTKASWADGALLRVPLGGGAVETLVEKLNGANRVALDEESAYYTEAYAQAVRRVSKAGGSVTTLAVNVDGNPQDIAVDTRAVYWVDPGNGKIMSVVK